MTAPRSKPLVLGLFGQCHLPLSSLTYWALPPTSQIRRPSLRGARAQVTSCGRAALRPEHAQAWAKGHRGHKSRWS